MSPTIRLFVAVPLPTDLILTLKQFDPVFADEPLRWMPDSNLHLTIFFIGNVNTTDLADIITKLKVTAANQEPFTLKLAAIEPGPDIKNPRLLWARFGNNQLFSLFTTNLQKFLTGQPVKKQKSIPHITLARIQKGKTITTNTPLVLSDKEINFTIQDIALWQSELKQPHPEYSILQKFKLNG